MVSKNITRDIKAGVQKKLENIPDVEYRFNYFTGQMDRIVPRKPINTKGYVGVKNGR